MKDDKGPAPAAGDLVMMVDPWGDAYAPARVESVDTVGDGSLVTAKRFDTVITAWWGSRYFRRHP